MEIGLLRDKLDPFLTVSKNNHIARVYKVLLFLFIFNFMSLTQFNFLSKDFSCK